VSSILAIVCDQTSAGTCQVLGLGAVRRLAYEAAVFSAPIWRAGIRRVKGVKKLGIRLGNWLTAERWDDGEGSLAYCEGIRQKHRSEEVGTARSATDLCSAPPRMGGELEQIQFLLGHVSLQTTERYLDCKQRIRSPVNYRIGIEPNA
jgi:hypothetical protein